MDMPTIGSLGLTGKEEDQIVTFLKTLTEDPNRWLPDCPLAVVKF
jgi:hypothetical protein